MPQPAASWRRAGLWRIALIAVSAGLGVAAVCLVVFGTRQKQLQLGVLLGLWGALIAACLIFRTRRSEPEPIPTAELEEARAQARELHEAQLKVATAQQEQLEAAKQAYFSQEIELRRFGELQHAREEAARREFELNLELFLRRELERVMAGELRSLREEVAALRAEVVDKLGGQLRLERIETTRVTGSDLEALQNEIRRLAGSPPAETAQRAGRRSADIVDAELVEFPPLPVTAELPAAEPPPERAGRRRAPEPDEEPEPRHYEGRRRAGSERPGRFAGIDR